MHIKKLNLNSLWALLPPSCAFLKKIKIFIYLNIWNKSDITSPTSGNWVIIVLDSGHKAQKKTISHIVMCNHSHVHLAAQRDADVTNHS
jgi:hypothetical protein